MFIVFGILKAGKVDAVPDMFHVTTQFAHLYYVPLIPTGSLLVLPEKQLDGEHVAIPIPLSWKSVLVGWLRSACIFGAMAACVIAISEINKNRPWGASLAAMLLALTVLFLSYRIKIITHASYERAVELGQKLGLSDMGELMIEIHYGRMNAEQADAELARREQLQYANSLNEQGNSVV
jgi:hypothetical protein